MSLEINSVHNGDCLDIMPLIDSKSIDMVLCDLPYGTTTQIWDSVIPFDLLWEQYERILSPRGTIVLTASQPFTSLLVASNLKLFKYEWIWQKNINSNFGNCKHQPLKHHESVLVFYKRKGVYNPQGLVRLDTPKICKNNSNRKFNHIVGVKNKTYTQTHTNYPKSIIEFGCERGLHPTQKPVSLFEYLIRTYTNEGNLVLDSVAGSGTTGVACKNTNRNYILIEKDPEYYNLILNRLAV